MGQMPYPNRHPVMANVFDQPSSRITLSASAGYCSSDRKPAPSNTMRYGRIAGLDKPISRLIMGGDNQRTLPHASVIFDDFYQKGGNAFDTAWIYGDGRTERLLGQWVRNRGLRDKVVHKKRYIVFALT